MGLWNSGKNISPTPEPIGLMLIGFSGRHEARVNFRVTPQEDFQVDVGFFCWYYARMVTNLNAIGAARDFMAKFDVTARRLFVEPRTTGIPNLGIVIEGGPINPTTVYSARFLRSHGSWPVMQTQATEGDEEYYAPASIVLLLRHVLGTLGVRLGMDAGALQVQTLALTVVRMHEFYAREGMGIATINSAPREAYESAVTAISSALE